MRDMNVCEHEGCKKTAVFKFVQEDGTEIVLCTEHYNDRTRKWRFGFEFKDLPGIKER